MKIALIIYVVTIVIYWVGALSVFTSVAKYLKEHPENKYHTTISAFFRTCSNYYFFSYPYFEYCYWRGMDFQYRLSNQEFGKV